VRLGFVVELVQRFGARGTLAAEPHLELDGLCRRLAEEEGVVTGRSAADRPLLAIGRTGETTPRAAE
jgi:hypothetical protein